jgi:muconolactone delta-isomerase
MKFLVIGTMKDTALALPPAMGRQIMEASIPVMNQQKKAGKIVEFYWVPAAMRSVVIRERNRAEEILQDMSEVPQAALMNVEIYPLADFNESMKIMLESLKAAEKMMPAPPK